MPSMTNLAVGGMALATMVQFCPAPFLGFIGAAVAANIGTISGVVGAASGVAGTVIAGVNSKRDIPRGLFRRQEEYGTGTAWQDCHDQLTGAVVTFSSPSAGSVLAQGVPSACMTLSTVITGKFNEGNPVPQGSDSILFSNLSNESIQEIQNALDARA